LVYPVAILDATFVVWIFISLAKTIGKLQVSKTFSLYPLLVPIQDQYCYTLYFVIASFFSHALTYVIFSQRFLIMPGLFLPYGMSFLSYFFVSFAIYGLRVKFSSYLYSLSHQTLVDHYSQFQPQEIPNQAYVMGKELATRGSGHCGGAAEPWAAVWYQYHPSWLTEERAHSISIGAPFGLQMETTTKVLMSG
jgi:hypothetical protein